MKNKAFCFFFSFVVFSINFILAASTAVRPAALVPGVLVTAPKKVDALTKKTINSADIQQNHYQQVTDALVSDPTLNVTQYGGQGKMVQVSLRGGNAEHTTVLLDGMRANDITNPSAFCDFKGLGTEGLGQIRILNGASMMDEDVEALAGVISLDTKKGYGSPKIDALVEGGSFSTKQIELGVMGQQNLVDYHFRFHGEATDGIHSTPESIRTVARQQQTDPTARHSFTSRVGLAVTETVRINVWNRLLASEDHYAEPYNSNPSRVADSHTQFHKIEVDHQSASWRNRLYYSLVHNRRGENADTLPFDESKQLIGKVDTLGSKNEWNYSDKYKIHANFSFEKHMFTQEYSKESDSIHGFLKARSEQNTFTIGHILQPNAQWVVEVWTRYQHYSLFRNRFTPKVATRYKIAQTQTTLSAGYTTGYQAPSLYQLYDPKYGNRNLKPEATKGYDLGIQQKIYSDNITIGINYFDQHYSQLIYSVQVADQWQFVNVDKAYISGVETFFEIKEAKKYLVRLDHCWLRARNANTNRSLKRRPLHKLSLRTLWHVTEMTTLGLQMTYLGRQEDTDPQTFTTVHKTGPLLVRLWADYKVSQGTKNDAIASNSMVLFARIENATHTKAQDPLGYAIPGFSFYMGMRLQIG